MKTLKKQTRYLVIFISFIILTNVSKSQSVEIALDQFLRFNNTEGGWCAADATISMLLPDGKTFWLFGDTFIGEKNGTYSIEGGSATFINNCAIIDDGTTLQTVYGGTQAEPSSLIPGIDGDIFWPEHATIENDTIKIFAIRIIYEDNGTPGFNFRVGTTHLAKFTYPGIAHISTEEIEYITDTTMRFGTHVLVRDDYTYIFGKKDTIVDGYKYPIPMLARVTESVDEPWEFFAGNDTWSLNCNDAVPIGDRPMSESFFVYEHNEKFYLIMHEIWLIAELYILEADDITGPFNKPSTGGIENKFCIINSPEDNFTYNLFAHPQFQNDGRILISFNVNGDFWSIFNDTRNYRGRFLWLSVDDAISTTIPDTVNAFGDYYEAFSPELTITESKPYFDIYANQIVIKNIHTPSLLNIYTLEGKKIFESVVVANQGINLEIFPRAAIILQLIHPEGVATKKIMNHHVY